MKKQQSQKHTKQVKPAKQPKPVNVNQAPQGGQEPLTAAMLVGLEPKQQKQMLGERLYPLVQKLLGKRPFSPGKVTGMILEMDNKDLLQLLESRRSLKSKVNEAVSVLEAHQAKQTST